MRLSLISKFRAPRVHRHIAMLRDMESRFQNFPELLLTFQTFNKAHTTRHILSPFLKAGCKNIVLFADGCADNTLKVASRLLPGKGHFVVNDNNLHEILNYSLAEKIAEWSGAEFMLLAQDDDIYPQDLSWLQAAIAFMKAHPDVATVGFNGGYNFVGSISDSDEGFATAKYVASREGGADYAKLEPYYNLISVPDAFRWNGTPFSYVDLIDRAPQLVRISFLKEINGWPRQFAPYNYDDIYLCLAAWKSGWKVAHMPLPGIMRDVGIGGMRLFNKVTTTGRRPHLARNWHLLFEAFGDFVNNGALRAVVTQACETAVR
ncbi:MAG TPA: hypothetical protein VFI23_15495 [Rhizomicrobium sp.]|nr:hypothetical protein [Rhizomicrobium sp.]